MILQALLQLAERGQLVPDPDYEVKQVAWLVPVAEGGELLPLRGTHILVEGNGGKTKQLAKSFSVPRQPVRTSGDLAFFLCDKSEYVFGLLPPAQGATGRTAEKLALRSALFRDRVSACVQATGDAAVIAVFQALEDVAQGRQRAKLSDDVKPNDLFGFIYVPDGEHLVHERPSVRQYWADQRKEAVKDTLHFQCVVTGMPMSEPGNFPKVKRVPGGTSSGVSLVSFNARAFESYGLSSNENAPISRAAAEAAATALDRLLHPAYPDPKRPNQALERRHTRLSNTTVVCYWADESEFADAFASLLEVPDDPRIVGDMYRSIWTGQIVLPREAGEFYALTLSGAQGRVIVRDWFEASVALAAANLARHFADLLIVRNTPNVKGRLPRPQIPLGVLLGSLAPFGNRDEIPAALAADIVRSAIGGGPYPISILQRALERTRAEIGRKDWSDAERRDARVALIKAVLNRSRRNEPATHVYPEVTVAMDPNNTQPGYLLGRLMAVIERLQQLALGDVNAGVVDRYFSSASATPRAVFVRLLKNARHHARKAKDDAKTGGTARWLERQIDAIAAPFDPKDNGFPAWLDLEQQGLFVIGYHHQRHALWAKRETPVEAEGEAAAPVTTTA